MPQTKVLVWSRRSNWPPSPLLAHLKREKSFEPLSCLSVDLNWLSLDWFRFLRSSQERTNADFFAPFWPLMSQFMAEEFAFKARWFPRLKLISLVWHASCWITSMRINEPKVLNSHLWQIFHEISDAMRQQPLFPCLFFVNGLTCF